MRFISDMIKGIFIGIANIIPGVSGGTMAVSMGIYDNIIYSLTHLFKEPKKCIQLLLPYGIGAVLGLAGLSFIIEFLFIHYPIQTNLFFIGLILGGLPIIVKRIRIKRVDIGHASSFLLFFALIIALNFLNNNGQEVTITLSLIEVLKLFLIGVIASATMVIPGVSGSMILMLMGYYQPILTMINDCLRAMIHFDIADLINPVFVLIPFGLGVVIGIFAIAKLIEILLKHYESMTFCAILGLVVASPIAILMNVSFAGMNPLIFFSSLICLVIGCIISAYLGVGD